MRTTSKAPQLLKTKEVPSFEKLQISNPDLQAKHPRVIVHGAETNNTHIAHLSRVVCTCLDDGD